MYDVLLKNETAMPAAASTSTTSAAIFIQPKTDPQAEFHGACEVEIIVPALTATQAPAGATATAEVLVAEADTTDGWTVAKSYTVGTVTAGSSGATSKTAFRFRLPYKTGTHIKGKVSLNATATDSSAVKFSTALVW